METPPAPASREHRDFLVAECARLLDFGAAAARPAGGAFWLDDLGRPDPDRPLFTWITARTVHVYALAVLLGRDGAAEVAGAALRGLTGPLRDAEHGGWFGALDPSGRRPVEDGKSCYDHVFVVLAGASAAVAGLPGGADLLAEALEVLDRRFWLEADGMHADHWDRGWRSLDGYRGLNANMHAVEALLAASDATGEPAWRDRAARIAARVVEAARGMDWLIPEHFDQTWTPRPEYNADRPDDRFKPYGATIGHSLEWSRLLVQLSAALGAGAPAELLPAARALFGRAVRDGWNVDGATGFVYTTDWSGDPVVRDRMHWVVAEAIGAAAALHGVDRRSEYAAWYETCWGYVREYLVDNEFGSWHHQLDRHNRPVATVWPGKPDVYHAVQATLLPRLPAHPGPAVAIRDGLLDQVVSA